MATVYRNLHGALPAMLFELFEEGVRDESRNGDTLELLHHAVTLTRPWERFQFHPARADNPFAKVAETLWILSGRSDVIWLSNYLPRALRYSDDGKVWRAGYGPRLRSWHGGVDQLRKVHDELLGSVGMESRRAVVSLWDPEDDWSAAGSLDYPCNNWIHFLVRGEQLHMAVAARSNDVWWGWSGINTFEWSVIQEALAMWLDVGIGFHTTFAGSWHLYTPYADKARRVVEQSRTVIDPYGLPSQYTSAARHILFDIPLDELDTRLAEFFELEAAMYVAKTDMLRYADIEKYSLLLGRWLTTCAHMLNVWAGLQHNVHLGDLQAYLELMPASDFKLAAQAYLTRHAGYGAAHTTVNA